MAEAEDSVSEPVLISKIGGRYLLFDVNVVTYLRRVYHICGSFMGSLPQIPQQNVFLGLPVELMPEEARLLVEKKAAYIVDDTAWHVNRFNTFEGEDRRKYLDSLRTQGLQARDAAHLESRKKSENYLRQVAAKKTKAAADTTIDDEAVSQHDNTGRVDADGNSGENSLEVSIASNLKSSAAYAVTRTTTHIPNTSVQNIVPQLDPTVPSSYALFKHLHLRDYYIMPGLRFGCDYNVYPGDPLRFHSHFLAVGYEWDQDIAMLDIIGGGRLGTAVKKGFLIGGKDPEVETSDGDEVRTFAIEWGGM